MKLRPVVAQNRSMPSAHLLQRDILVRSSGRLIGEIQCAGDGEKRRWLAVVQGSQLPCGIDVALVQIGENLERVIEGVSEETLIKLFGGGEDAERAWHVERSME